MGACSFGKSKTLPGRAALHRRLFARWFLPARARQNLAGEKPSAERPGDAAARADLLLQHGLLRRASRQFEIGPSALAHQFQNGSFLPRDREEGSGFGSGPGIDLGRDSALRCPGRRSAASLPFIDATPCR